MLLLMFFVTPSTNENSSIYISSNRMTGAFLLSEKFISNSAFSESTLKAITQSKILSRLLLSIAFRSQFALLSKIDQLTIYASVEQVDVYLSYIPNIISILLDVSINETLE